MMELSLIYWSLPISALLDALLGDPRGWPHPVRWIGRLIALGERLVSPGPHRPILARFAGVVLTLCVVTASAGSAWLFVSASDRLGGLFPVLGRVLLIYWGLAARSLGNESLLAADAPDLPTARRELSMIVGRDVDSLDWPDIRLACVETVGENTSDGVIAPLFWYALLGPAGLWGYKSINTLDSMIGHKNEQYRYFGWFAARLDDVAGIIPARLTWLLICFSALLLAERPWNAFRLGWRDGRKHSSPNAAWGEAAMAGALGVQVGGTVTYDGIPSSRALLGDLIESIGAATVRRSVRLMYVTATLGVLIAWVCRSGAFGLP